jgi:branched-chain amino acid transport system ATP-binding protein
VSGPLLEVEGLDVAYGGMQALWGVGFRVDEGEIVTLVGANGAGKTTTLKTVAGLLRPRRGRIRFAGEEIAGRPAHQVVSRGLALVPEGRQVWPAMTVEDHLLLGAYLPAARPGLRDRLEEVYRLFPVLRERRRQRAGTLSGGEQQMLAIGRGLIARPRLLMLDEPSLGLAPKVVQEVLAAIRAINGQGVAVLLVEQNVHYALAIAHRGYVLETGRITLEGEGRSLLSDEHVRRTYLGVG